MKVGFIQPPYPGTASSAESGAVVAQMLEILDGASGDLVVLPEYANVPGLTDPDALLRVAESGAENFLGRVAEAARRRRGAVAVNVLQRLAGGISNVTWLFDARGEAAGRYIKTHLSPFERDALRLAAGDKPVVIEWNGLRVGFLTCFDIYFAEFAEALAALAPDLVIFPAYQRSEDSLAIVRQAVGRALDLEAFLIRCSYAVGNDYTRGGHSLVADPTGAILLDGGQATGSFAVDIDPHRKRIRPQSFGLPPLSSRRIVEEHRRPSLYRPAGPGVGGRHAAPFPRVVAHRGLSGVCPENTLPAFAAALALGADEIEFDLWASRDGELVVCHDDTVDRTSNGCGLIRDLCWGEIRRLDAGAWHHPDWAGVPFCRLEDVLEQFGGRIVMNIHIKEPGPDGLVIRRTRELAAQVGVQGEIYIAGDRPVLEQAVKLAPDVARCCLEGAESGARMLDCAVEFGCTRVQFWNPNFTPDDVARAHKNGIVCNLFFGDRPDTPQEAVRLCGMDIDAVLTNWANTVAPAVRRKGVVK